MDDSNVFFSLPVRSFLGIGCCREFIEVWAEDAGIAVCRFNPPEHQVQ